MALSFFSFGSLPAGFAFLAGLVPFAAVAFFAVFVFAMIQLLKLGFDGVAAIIRSREPLPRDDALTGVSAYISSSSNPPRKQTTCESRSLTWLMLPTCPQWIGCSS